MANKGGSFEREIAKKLSLWWTNGKDDNIFWRTQNSGGRATQRRKSGKHTIGDEADLKATNPIGQPLMDVFGFELKTGYKDAILQDLFFHYHDRPKKTRDCIWNWIRKAREVCRADPYRHWALIHKRKGREPIIVMEQWVFTSLHYNGENYSVKMGIRVGSKKNTRDDNHIVAVLLNEFLECVPPEAVIQRAKWYTEFKQKAAERDKKNSNREFRKAQKEGTEARKSKRHSRKKR